MLWSLKQYINKTPSWIASGCLKILPPEELQHLDIPAVEEPTNLVKKVVYISQNDLTYVAGNSTLPEQHTEPSRFNMFTGYQTLDQREESFKVEYCILMSLTLFRKMYKHYL